MDDLRAVMDAVGSKSASVFGVSEGANLCALFAATYPDRTDAMVAFGSFAKRIWSPDYPWAPTTEEREREYETLGQEWGKKMDVEHYVPSKVHDEEFVKRVVTYFRRAASPGAAVTLLRMNTQIDIRGILASIHVPTLIIHRTGDRDANVEGARWMAQQIPNARFVELTGDDHLHWVGDQDAVLDEIQEFITGERPKPDITRVLMTILFTDIVDSTQLAHDIGDAEWKVLLEKHDDLCQQKIQHFRGKLVKSTGDGVHATFDGPGRGIACAKEIIQETQALGLRIRAGLHTGECELRGGEVEGVAVNLAARVSALAAPGQVLVTRTVRDLVSGSGITFKDHGVHELKGFPEPWQIFVA